MSKRALLLIDLQNDFCTGGSLEVANGSQTITVANQLINWCKHCGASILASQDWHPADHGSFASQQGCAPFTEGILHGLQQTWWPDHCIQYSHGAELHPQLAQQHIDVIIRKGQNPAIDSYSAFFDNGYREKTELDHWLKQRGVTSLLIMGLATDFCVKFTVMDALQLGYQVTVIRDGCRGVNMQPNDSELALQDMQYAGASIETLQHWFDKER